MPFRHPGFESCRNCQPDSATYLRQRDSVERAPNLEKLQTEGKCKRPHARTLTQIAEKHAGVYIKTGERTFFEDMLRPVLDSFSHAFREH